MNAAKILELDARGFMCPRPIIELAKLRRKTTEPCHVHIVADDLAFESDVAAWCETTGNTLLTVEHLGDGVHATIDFKARS
ncbi:MAG: sulfurtransferase TusA family protein [Deltaproteobacteria bacterium]|nr:sulfurtransferase TusA family protein [Deltaproteobacteria bacterium]